MHASEQRKITVLRLILEFEIREGHSPTYSEIAKSCPRYSKRSINHILKEMQSEDFVIKEEKYPDCPPKLLEERIQNRCRKQGLWTEYLEYEKQSEESVRNHAVQHAKRTFDQNHRYTSMYYKIKGKTVFGHEQGAGKLCRLGKVSSVSIGDDSMIRIGEEIYGLRHLPNIQYYVITRDFTFAVKRKDWFDTCLNGKMFDKRRGKGVIDKRSRLTIIAKIRRQEEAKVFKPRVEYVLTSKGMNYVTTGQKIGTETFEIRLSPKQVAELFLSDRGNLRRAFPDAERYKRAVKTLEQMSEQDTVQKTAS